MEFDAWWILVGIALFAAGWFSARIDIRHVVRDARALPASYFRGLNFLLNEKPDQAIESFLQVVKERPETLDLQLALGSLFRKQGEVHRATRIHQSLVDRPDLTEDRRLQALAELAQDYYKAGLLDRAEELFAKLEGTSHEQSALQSLIKIFEQEKDWDRAIETSRKLEKSAGVQLHKEIAQYHCERAAGALRGKDYAGADAALDLAMNEHKRCARAYLLRGDLLMAKSQPAAAIAQWESIERHQAAFLSLAAPKLQAAYAALQNTHQASVSLRHYQSAYPSPDLLRAAYESIEVSEGPAAAQSFLKAELAQHGSLMGLERYLSASDHPDRDWMRAVLLRYTQALGTYRCGHCGFRAKQYYWQCPGCTRWETYAPSRSDSDAMLGS